MQLINYASEFSALIFIIFVITISPGPDFIITVRNSMMYGRTAGIYSAFGIATSIWVHVGYSIAGLALIISQSITLFLSLSIWALLTLSISGIRLLHQNRLQVSI